MSKLSTTTRGAVRWTVGTPDRVTTHPGEVLAEEFLGPLGMSVNALARECSGMARHRAHRHAARVPQPCASGAGGVEARSARWRSLRLQGTRPTWTALLNSDGGLSV